MQESELSSGCQVWILICAIGNDVAYGKFKFEHIEIFPYTAMQSCSSPVDLK